MNRCGEDAHFLEARGDEALDASRRRDAGAHRVVRLRAPQKHDGLTSPLTRRALATGVVVGLAGDGIHPQDYRPRQITTAMVVLCGRDLPSFTSLGTNVER